jgi:hypothetical protein
MRFLFWIRVLVLMWCCTGVANATNFSVGGSLTAIGTFGTGLFGTGLPGTVGVAARVEWLDSFAPGFSIRLDAGTRGLETGIGWRLDLSSQVNLTINVGFAWLEWTKTGLYGRFGLEYRFADFAVAFEYGWLSPFAGTPNIRSSALLSFVYFFKVS